MDEPIAGGGRGGLQAAVTRMPRKRSKTVRLRTRTKIACSRLLVRRTIEKASGRQAGSAASGIRETPLIARPPFQSSALTESLDRLEQRLRACYDYQFSKAGRKFGEQGRVVRKPKYHFFLYKNVFYCFYFV